MKYQKHLKQKGQALITLLVFMVMAVTITSAAVVTIVVNTQGSLKVQEGTTVLNAAESGAENALLRLLRDPNYAGETLSVGDSIVVITVAGTTTKTITSVATTADINFKRTVQVVAGYTNNILTVSSWQEVF